MCNQGREIRARDQYELFNSLESMDIAEWAVNNILT